MPLSSTSSRTVPFQVAGAVWRAWQRAHGRTLIRGRTSDSSARSSARLDDQRVLALVHWQGHGKRSGVDLKHVRSTGAQVFHVRDGKVHRFVHYWDREHALADLDLKE
jgi:ketosteroid isomerase-like protein